MTQDSYQIRSFDPDADTQALIDLINVCDAIDAPGQIMTLDELRLFLGRSNFDPANDMRVWTDENGALVASATVFFSDTPEEAEGRLNFFTHPAVRGQAVEEDLLAWATSHTREAAGAIDLQHKPFTLRTRFRDTDAYRTALLAKHNFYVERFYLALERPLAEPIAAPVFPAGFMLRHATSADAAAYVEAFNLSFIDHWNHHPWTSEDFTRYTETPIYQPELNLIAVAPDGVLAAFCWCAYDKEANRSTGRNAGEISLLGTRRGYRGLGLARAMLMAGLQALKNEGLDTATLRVDAQNPTGARQLYESAGFTQEFALAFYTRDLKRNP